MASKHGIFSYSVGPHSVLSTLCVLKHGISFDPTYTCTPCVFNLLKFLVPDSRPWQVKNGDSQQFRERKLLGIPGNDFKVSIQSGNGRICCCRSEARLHTPVLQK